MPALVALKSNNEIYVGSDSCFVNSSGDITFGLNESTRYIHKVKGIENALILDDGGNILEHNVIQSINFDEIMSEGEEVDFECVRSKIAPLIHDAMEQNGCLGKGDNPNSSSTAIIIATKDKIFLISEDFSVIEGDDFLAIGDTKSKGLLTGSLLTTYDAVDPKERILIALRAANKFSRYVSSPYILSNTEDCEMEIIKR